MKETDELVATQSRQISSLRFLPAVVTLVVIGAIGSAHFAPTGEDSDSYINLMINRWDLVHQPFSSRFLHAEVVGLLIRWAGISVLQAAIGVAWVAMALSVFGMALIFSKLKAAPPLLLPTMIGLAFLQTFQLIYMPDLFYTVLLVGFFLLLMSDQMLLSAAMVFVLFCARESTLVLGAVLIALLIQVWWPIRGDSAARSKKVLIAAAFFVATAAGFLFNRHVASKSAGNIHHVSALLYLVGKVPFNFMKNVLGIDPWTNTLTATEGDHPIYRHAVPHGLHLGEIHEIGIAEMSLRYPLGWLTNSLCMFGVLLTVVCRQVLFNIVQLRSKIIGRFGWLRLTLMGIKQTLLEQPFYSRVALFYGLISFAIVPVLGTAVHRYIYYSWPAFWITGILLLQRQYLDGPWSMSPNHRVRLLIVHILLVGCSILVTCYSAHWAPMLAFFIAAIILQRTAWLCLSKVTLNTRVEFT